MRLKDVAELNVRSLDDSTSGDYVFKYIDISSVSFENGITLGEDVRGNLAVSNFRKMSLPTYEIQIKDYGYRKFNKKIHIMEQNL